MKASDVTGKELRHWRQARGWQRSWLAEKIGVSPSAMWKWEQDEAIVPHIVTVACAAIRAELDPICSIITKEK